MNESPFIGVYPYAVMEDYCDRMIAKHQELEKNTSGSRGKSKTVG